MFEHTRTRSGKYPNHARQFKCCNSFISNSSLAFCYRFVLLDRAWPHMNLTTYLSPKPESYRQVKLAQTLERNHTATSKNHSNPDPLQPTTSTKPPKLCSIPQHLKKHPQKIDQTTTPTPPAYTQHTQNWQHHTQTLPKHSCRQQHSTPTQTNPHNEPTHNQKTLKCRPPKTPETRSCRHTPLNYVVPSTQLSTKRPHKQNPYSLQTPNPRHTIQTASPYPAQNNHQADTQPQKPPIPCLTLTQYVHTQTQPIHKHQQFAQNNHRADTQPQMPPIPCLTLTQDLHTQTQPTHKNLQLVQNNHRTDAQPQKPSIPCLTLTQYLHTQPQPTHKHQQFVVSFPKKIQTPRASKTKSNLSILDTVATQLYETETQPRNIHLRTNPTMCRNQEGGQLIKQKQK
jgi:hypothetical protein